MVDGVMLMDGPQWATWKWDHRAEALVRYRLVAAGDQAAGSWTSEGSNGSLTSTCAVYGENVRLTGTADAFFGIRVGAVHDISCCGDGQARIIGPSPFA
jgi:hypothetical protein